jgi:hypothetical protein
VTCLSPRNPSSLDYISQRMNEYLHFSGSFSTPDNIEVNPTLFVKKIKEGLIYNSSTINGQNYSLENGQYLIGDTNQSNIYRPYDSSDALNFIPRSYKSYSGIPGREAELMDDLILYDQPLSDILPRDMEGEIRRRRITEVSPDFEEGTRDLVFEEVFLPPIEMVIGPDTDVGYLNNEINNMSVYAFIYLDYDNFLVNYDFEPDENTLHTTLVTGVGRTTHATVMGNQYLYRPITEETPYVSRILEQVNQSPDAGLLQDMRLQSFPDYSAELFNLHDNVFQSRDGSSLERSDTGKLILKDDSFSDLWITKDINENARYMFSFSLINFLLERSQFPMLYANKDIAEKLLNGFEYNGETYRSEVNSIRMSRQFVKPLSYIENNNLGTDLRLKLEQSSFTYPQTYIRTPSETSLYLPSFPTLDSPPLFGNLFYEGTDDFLNQKSKLAYHDISDKPERPGIYRYASEVEVKDMSKIFLLKALKDIQEAKSEFNRLLHFLLDPTFGYFDSVTRRLNRPINEIPYNGSNARVWITQNSINPYLEYLQLFRLVPFVHFGVSPLGHLRNLLFKLLDSGVPEDLQEIVRTIEVLETNLAVTADVYHTTQYGSQDEGSGKSSLLYQKGVHENGFPILYHKNQFDQLHSFGYKNGLGYSYVVSDEEEIANTVGLGRIHRDRFQQRLRSEFNKYFYASPGDNIAPSQPFLQGGSAQEPSYQYLTPAYIFCPEYKEEKGGVSQIDANQAQESLLNLNLNKYSDLFSQLFKSYYGMEYLNFVFYNNTHEMSFDTPTRQTYNSLLGILDEEYSCNISTTVIKQFEVPTPKYFSDQVNPLTGLTDQQEDLARAGGLTLPERIPVPQTILGGRGDQSSLTTTYYDTITDQYVQDEKNTESLEENDIFNHVPKDQNPPLKLTFGILGELEFDNTIDFHAFQDNPLNNMRSLGQILGVTSQTVEEDINFTPQETPGRLAHLPNQLKAMLAIAFSDQEIKINNSFNIKRSVLYDHDAVDRFSNAISYHNEDNINGNPPFSMVYDPMQVYSKFLSLWMNFKQLIKVEYLDGFGSTVGPVRFQDSDELINGNKPSMPVWRILTKEVFDSVMRLDPDVASNKQNHILCRIGIVDYNEMLGDSESLPSQRVQLERLAKCLNVPELLNLPIYHRYFCVGPSLKLDTKTELQQMEQGG